MRARARLVAPRLFAVCLLAALAAAPGLVVPPALAGVDEGAAP